LGDGSVGAFLGSHPAALRFVQAPKPFVESYATQEFYALHSYGLEASDGKVTWLKYTISPVLGVKALDTEAAKAKSPDYLHDEILERVKTSPVEFKLVGTLAKEGDSLNDITVEWEGPHETVDLGTFKLESAVDKDAEVQKYNIADPEPKVDGIKKPEGDKILEFRSALYIISGKERRSA
jgi:catalase